MLTCLSSLMAAKVVFAQMSRGEFELFLLVQQHEDLLRKHEGDPRLFLFLLPLCDKADYALFWMWYECRTGGAVHACWWHSLKRTCSSLAIRPSSCSRLFPKIRDSLKLKSYLWSDACIFWSSVSVVRLVWSTEGTLQKHQKSLSPPRQNFLHNKFTNLFLPSEASRAPKAARARTTDTLLLLQRYKICETGWIYVLKRSKNGRHDVWRRRPQ